MQTTSGMPASAASSMASGAPRGAGRRCSWRWRPSRATASRTVSKTGTRPSSAIWPPLPGVTPATMFVPYSSMAVEWNSPSRPVMPWTSRRVSRVDQDAHATLPWPPATALAAASSRLAAVSRLACSRISCRLLGVGADDAHHHRHVALDAGPCLHDAARHLVAAGDAAEDVDQDRLHVRVVQDDAEGCQHLVGLGTAADVQEVGRLAAGELDEVHGGHRQAGPVDHAADVAVQLDEVDARLARRDLGWLLLVEVAHLLQLRVAEERRVVQRDLGVQRQQPAVSGDHQRVDLGQVGVNDSRRRAYSPRSVSAKSWRSSAGMPRKKLARRTLCGCRPSSGWRGMRRIASGLVRAVSSISTPPSALAMTVTDFSPRSRMRPR